MWRRLFQCLFRTRLTKRCCHSRVEGKSITLSREYVMPADGVLVQLVVQWPLLLLRWRPPRVFARLVGADGCCLRETLSCTTNASARTSRLNIEVPPGFFGDRERIRIQVWRAGHNHPLADLAFDRVDLGGVARGLQTERFTLCGWPNGKRVACDHLHDQLEEVGFVLQLRLDNSEHCSFLSQAGADLCEVLRSSTAAARPIGIWQHPLRFADGSLRWENRLGAAPALFTDGPGSYELEFHVGETRIATQSFEVLSFATCVASARESTKQNTALLEAAFSTVDHRGVAGPLDVVAEDFRQIKISLALDAPRSEPLLDAVELTLGFVLRRQNTVVHSQQRNVSVRPGRQHFEVCLDLTPQRFKAGPGKYQLECFLDDRLLQKTDFRHKTRAEIRAETAEVILQSLSLTKPRLFACRDGTRVETDHLFETDTAIVPTFCIRGSGFDEDVPAVQWRLKLKWVNLDSGKVTEEQRFLCAKSGENLHDDLEWPLYRPGSDLPPGRYVLQLSKRDEVLTEFQFRVLSKAEIVPYTHKVVRESLRAEGAQLFVQAGPMRYQSRLVPDTSDYLLPELMVHSAGYNSFLPRIQTHLRLLLLRDADGPTELAALPVTLSPAPLMLRNLAVKVGDWASGATSSACCLVLTVADMEVASFPFQMVSGEEVLRHVRASVVTLEAIGKSGCVVRNPASLQLGEHEAFGVMVDIEVGLLAPNMAADCALLLKRDNIVVGHAHAELQLDRPRQTIRGKKVRLASIAPPQSFTPQELEIVVVIGGEEKDTRSIEIINGRRISNFEGQLTVDPHRLEVPESEYQAILSRL
jgi:hypothetical protein